MSCCDDPKEPAKVDTRELRQDQQHLGHLLRDLVTDNPENVIIRELHQANAYLRELAALKAYSPAIRLVAINLLEQESLSVLERIIVAEAGTEMAKVACQRQQYLEKVANSGLLNRLKQKLGSD